MAAEKGRHPQLLRAVMEINDDRRRAAFLRIQDLVGELRGKTLGLLGLSSSPIPTTCAMRPRSPSPTSSSPRAPSSGATTCGHVGGPTDHAAGPDGCRPLCPRRGRRRPRRRHRVNEFKALDFERLGRLMKRPVIFDARNMYDPEAMARVGFSYRGMDAAISPTTRRAEPRPRPYSRRARAMSM